MTIKSVILVGSGGNLAPSVLKALLASNLRVTVLTRQSSKSTISSDVKVIRVSDDYPRDELVEAFKGQDAVVSVVAPNQKTLIDAAIEAGVKRFIPSDFGSDNGNVEAQRAVPEWRKKGSFFKIDIANKKALVLDDGDHPWSTSNLHQVGAAVVRVLEKPEETKNKFIFIESFTVTQNQILEGLEKELGIKFERETVDGKQWFKETADRSAAGDVPAGYAAIIGWTVLDGSFKDKANYANKLIDLPEENFKESLKAAVKRLKA